ncbi:Uncharacterized protein pbN1_14410 [Aromatoleum bremense]|nr:Uncharacterized protein pbN1_14410 [Aromatoleum bremense]
MNVQRSVLNVQSDIGGCTGVGGPGNEGRQAKAHKLAGIPRVCRGLFAQASITPAVVA